MGPLLFVSETSSWFPTLTSYQYDNFQYTYGLGTLGERRDQVGHNEELGQEFQAAQLGRQGGLKTPGLPSQLRTEYVSRFSFIGSRPVVFVEPVERMVPHIHQSKQN